MPVFRVSGLGFRVCGHCVLGALKGQGLGFRVQGLGINFMDPGLWQNDTNRPKPKFELTPTP